METEHYSRPLFRLIDALALTTDDEKPIDIIEFAQSKQYLGLDLYPRQIIILKLYYRLELTDAEFADVKDLLSCQSKYKRLFFPGLCAHHITGECERKICHGKTREVQAEYRQLTDAEIRSRLQNHKAHILFLLCGRRGSKSMVGGLINLFEQYQLLKMPVPQCHPKGYWKLAPGQKIGTINVAVDETQALILFDQMKGLMANSPFFKKVEYRSLQRLVDYGGRGIFAWSAHSHSASVRGNTLMVANLDEFCWVGRTSGSMGDKAMLDALSPSIVTFGSHAKIVISSSPSTQDGEGYIMFNRAEEGRTKYVIAFQLATWEMNPTITLDDPELSRTYEDDPMSGEVEFGAQWAQQANVYFKPEIVDSCISKDLKPQLLGTKGLRYSIHIDMSKNKDSVGLAITHWDKVKQKVVTDFVEEFDPQGTDDEIVNLRYHEIDQEKVFKYIVNLKKKGFRFHAVTFDQFNSEWLVQSLRREFQDKDGKMVYVLTFTEKSNREMYSNFRSLMYQGAIQYYDDSRLIRQLKNLAKVSKPSGAWKIEAPPKEKDDMADALVASVYTCLIHSNIIVGEIIRIPQAQEDAYAEFGVAVEEVIKTLAHHPDCKIGFYCDMLCPIARLMMNSGAVQ